jgi:sugar/nucleoside kinase (ribokinase family)
VSEPVDPAPLDETAFRGRRLCVVGNVNRDVRTAPIPAGEYLFADGETPAAFIRETVGGGGANSALAAAALGADARLVGKVGEDPLGYRLEAVLAAHNVRPFLARDDEQPSGTSVNLVFDTGRRHFISCLPSSATLSLADVDRTALAGCEHLLRADVWFSEPMLYGGNEALFRAARGAGVAVSLDVNWDPAWNRGDEADLPRRKEAIRTVLPLVDLVHGNVKELCSFADAEELDAALARIAAWGAGAVVVHMGADGAGYYRHGPLLREPCVPAPRIVNTTGTGDVLSVCMMLLHHREDVAAEQKLRLANQVVSEYVAGLRSFVPEL